MEGNLSTTYREQIKLLFTQLSSISDWHYVGKVGRFNVANSAPYVRLECIFEGSVAQFGIALSDTSAITREQWDVSTVSPVREKRLTRLCLFDESNIELINWNHSLRIQWKRASEKEVLILQSTTMHPVYKSDPSAKHNDCMYLIKELDPHRVHILYIGIIDTSATIVHASDLIRNTDRFRRIYDSWKCPNCSHIVPAHELECRHCKLERYRRCPDKRCYREQRENATICEYCGLAL